MQAVGEFLLHHTPEFGSPNHSKEGAKDDPNALMYKKLVEHAGRKRKRAAAGEKQAAKKGRPAKSESFTYYTLVDAVQQQRRESGSGSSTEVEGASVLHEGMSLA